MPIPNWPIEDRPREKLLQKGEKNLTDAELIAIFLKTGAPGKTALDIAKDLLAAYGSLRKLLAAPSQSVIERQGMGLAKYASLKAAIELGRRFLSEHPVIGKPLNTSAKTQKFLADRLQSHTNEVFACLFMDQHFRLISFEELFHGTIHSASIYPREIVKRSLFHNAAKLILAHNHPSGCSMPSAADKEVTKCIKEALALIDVEVVDHIIIGEPDHFSFAEAGLIAS